ncbi:hypothetical protein [Komagataeibacter saccharivorans]|uniref:hypothetical protein n=1 Tax=Komagataeibacter saccharivorans TaxID=265959 RepID=UPI000C82E836|nr:hypothetical protein [Komagataeibacter saccharivorans]
MPAKPAFLGAIMLLAALCTPPVAQAHTHRINLLVGSHHMQNQQHISSPYGTISGHHIAQSKDSGTYAGIEAKCEALSGTGTYMSSTTIGISRVSHRNYFRDCMLRNGAWQ